MNDDEGSTWSRDTDVVASEGGTISDGFDLPVGVVSRYTVTATGFSGVATTAFDDDDASFAIDRQPATGSGSANAGQPYEFTTTASVNKNSHPTTGISFGTPKNNACAGTATDMTAAGRLDRCERAGTGPGLTLTQSSTPVRISVTPPAVASGLYRGLVKLGIDQGGAAEVTVCLNVSSRQNQTITFNQAGQKTYGDADFDPATTDAQGLAVSYSVDPSSSTVCSSASNKVHILSDGNCRVTASQPGNASYNPATPVTSDITINKKPITGSFSAANKVYDGRPWPWPLPDRSMAL